MLANSYQKSPLILFMADHHSPTARIVYLWLCCHPHYHKRAVFDAWTAHKGALVRSDPPSPPSAVALHTEVWNSSCGLWAWKGTQNSIQPEAVHCLRCRNPEDYNRAQKRAHVKSLQVSPDNRLPVPGVVCGISSRRAPPARKILTSAVSSWIQHIISIR